MAHFEKLHSIATNLQTKGQDISDARYTLDQACRDYPIMSHYLSANADIVHEKAFESAVFKILTTKESTPSTEERSSVSELCISNMKGIKNMRTVKKTQNRYHITNDWHKSDAN